MVRKVYPKTAESPEPEEPHHYLLAANGVFLAKDNVAFRAVVKVEPLRELRLVRQEEAVRWKLPKIPFRKVQQAVDFFRQVKRLKKSEALLQLYYNPAEGAFDLYPPEQVATAGSVSSVEHRATPEGWVLVGTMHAHPGSAFHSGTDQHDESWLDGLHITVGNLDDVIPEFDAEVVVKGRRFQLESDAVLDYQFEIPREWVEKVRAENAGPIQRFGLGGGDPWRSR